LTAGARGISRQLEYPVSYLDFETIARPSRCLTASNPTSRCRFNIPAYRPPASAKSRFDPEHRQFLAEGTADRAWEFMRQLRADLPETGSVVAYNAGFGNRTPEGMLRTAAGIQTWFAQSDAAHRGPAFALRGFRYHHPDQNGSNSMKAVLPP